MMPIDATKGGQMPFDHPFYFLRHGETTWNAARMTQGQLDSPLSRLGKAQAQAAAVALAGKPIRRIVASPLTRARETAEAVAYLHGLPVEEDPELMECHLGEHQGRPHGPFLKDYFTGDYDPPGGETFAEFSGRAWHALERHADENTLIVCHGGLWISANAHTTITPTLLPMKNALPIRVTPGEDGWRAEALSP